MTHFVPVECNKKTLYLVSRLLLDTDKTSLVITNDGSMDRILDLFSDGRPTVRDSYHVIGCMAPTYFVVSRREVEETVIPDVLFHSVDLVERALTFIGNKRSLEVQDEAVQRVFDDLHYQAPAHRILPRDPTPDQVKELLAIALGTEEDPLPYPAPVLPQLGEGHIHALSAMYMKLTGSYHFPLLLLNYTGAMHTVLSVIGGVPVDPALLADTNIGKLSMNQCTVLHTYNKYSHTSVQDGLVEYAVMQLTHNTWDKASVVLNWVISGWSKRDRKMANVAISTDALALALTSPTLFNQAKSRVKKQVEALANACDLCRGVKSDPDSVLWPGCSLKHKVLPHK